MLSDVVGHSMMIAAVSVGDRSRMALGEVVTGNFFQMLGIRTVVGRPLMPEDDNPGAPRVVVISHGLWTREHGANPAVVGQTMTIHGQKYTIVGVAARSYNGMIPMVAASLWIPMAYVDDGEPGGIISVVPSPTGNTRLERRGTRWMFLKGRLKPGVTVPQAQSDMQVIAQNLAANAIRYAGDGSTFTGSIGFGAGVGLGCSLGTSTGLGCSLGTSTGLAPGFSRPPISSRTSM